MMISFSTTFAMAEGSGKQKASPFLITTNLPHLTKLLMQKWDNSELQLTEEQRTKLLVIRKDTIGGVKSFGKEITALEEQVVKGSLGGKSPEELQGLVGKIEKLKGAATMLHLQCIYKTSNILDKEQLAVLKK
jgi:hypothetical protein